MKKTDNEITDFLHRIQDAGRQPGLNRAQKKQILSEVFPKRPMFMKIAPAMMVFMFLLGGGVSYALVSNSKPGSPLYDIKRGIEDLRSAVQPSYNVELIEKRDQELNVAQQNGDDDAVQHIENEKAEIQKRIESDSSSSDDDEGNQSSETNDDNGGDTTSNDDTAPHDSKDDTSSETHTDDDTSNSSNMSSRDQCRADLDERKRDGENISSDDYKACD